jgi:hypothetical protein
MGSTLQAQSRSMSGVGNAVDPRGELPHRELGRREAHRPGGDPLADRAPPAGRRRRRFLEPLKSGRSRNTPVTLPPGRPRLVGMIAVAPRAAWTAGGPAARMASTRASTRSVASAGKRERFPSANRMTMSIAWLPWSSDLLRLSRTAVRRCGMLSACPGCRTPTAGFFAKSCARTAIGDAVTALIRQMNSRLLTRPSSELARPDYWILHASR